MALWYDCGNGFVKTSFARKDMNADAYLCCPGPSLADVDTTTLQNPGSMVFAINTAYPKVRPDVWMGLDVPNCYDSRVWWEPFIKITRMNTADGTDMTISGGQLLRTCPNTFFLDLEPADAHEMVFRRDHDIKFVWRKDTLTAMLHLMIWMGIKKIRLLGADFGGRSDYWDDRQLNNDQRSYNKKLYEQQVQMLRNLMPYLEANQIELISCTPNSPINNFLEFQSLPEAQAESAQRVAVSVTKPLHCKDAEFCKWNPASRDRGIIVGCETGQDELLDGWWENYEKNNSLPVLFADFGLSDISRKKCETRGQVLSVKDVPVKDGLRKPFAILGSPFRQTLWLDLDLGVCGNLDHMFSYIDDKPNGIAMQCASRPVVKNENAKWYRSMPIDKEVYCTRIVVMNHGDPLISDCAAAALDESMGYNDDHEVLSHLITLNERPVETFTLSACVALRQDLREVPL